MIEKKSTCEGADIYISLLVLINFVYLVPRSPIYGLRLPRPVTLYPFLVAPPRRISRRPGLRISPGKAPARAPPLALLAFTAPPLPHPVRPHPGPPRPGPSFTLERRATRRSSAWRGPPPSRRSASTARTSPPRSPRRRCSTAPPRPTEYDEARRTHHTLQRILRSGRQRPSPASTSPRPRTLSCSRAAEDAPEATIVSWDSAATRIKHSQYFADRDTFCAVRAAAEDLQRVAAANGGTVQTSMDNGVDELLRSSTFSKMICYLKT